MGARCADRSHNCMRGGELGSVQAGDDVQPTGHPIPPTLAVLGSLSSRLQPEPNMLSFRELTRAASTLLCLVARGREVWEAEPLLVGTVFVSTVAYLS